MSSPVAICNEALRRVGANVITSLDDDSTEAKVCKAVYTSELEELLDEHDWRFATQRLELTADVDPPAWGYGYAYTLPSTVLRVLQVDDGSLTDELAWEREGDQILCDFKGPLYLKYLKRVDDTAKFPPTFEDALSYRIAAEICVPLTQNASLYELLLKVAEKKVREAQAKDASQARYTFTKALGLTRYR